MLASAVTTPAIWIAGDVGAAKSSRRLSVFSLLGVLAITIVLFLAVALSARLMLGK